MSSIPLAANNLRVPEQQPNALEQYARIMQLKQQQALMPGQLQQQQQQIQAGNLENQQRQQQLKNVQVAPDVLKEWYQGGKDINQLPQIVAKHGGTIDLANSLIKQQQDVENLTKDQRTNQLATNDALMGHIDAMKGIDDPAKRAQTSQQQATQILRSGLDKYLDPQSVQMVQAVAAGQHVPTDDELNVFEKGLTAHSVAIKDSLTAAETAKNNAQAGEAQAQTRKINAEINPDNPANPDIRKQKYEGILQKVQQGGLSTVSPADLSFARSYENGQRKTTTQSDSLGVTSTNTSAPSGLAAAAGQSGRQAQGGAPAMPQRGGASTPQGASVKESIVDAIGQYKYNPTLFNRMAAKHPDILAAVTQKYPDFSQSNYNAANKAITDLAPSGKTGQQITSYNTFLRHAGALYDAVNSLDNSKYSDLLNKPMNWLAQHTGDPRVADFMAAMQPPMKEFQSFLLNNHAMHEDDVKDAHSLIDVNKTPQEIKAVLNRFAETGSARLSEQNESFKRVTGRDIPNLVSPEAAAAYNKITAKGGNGGGVTVTAPNGKTYSFKDQASADAFKAKAGIK